MDTLYIKIKRKISLLLCISLILFSQTGYCLAPITSSKNYETQKTIHDINEVKGKIFFSCTACMSVWADSLSWANAHLDRITKNPEEADNIILLSCQVTDLSILHDFRTIEKYQNIYPGKKFYISGCLAQRIDVKFPSNVKRLEQMRTNYQPLKDKSLVHYEKPYWIKDFKEKGENLDQGHLFRNMYPLRIGKGCPFNCTYCTIRITRGKHKEYDINDKLIKEFEENDNVVLIADSPTVKQIKDWCNLAIEKNKPISIRNVEPHVAVKCKDELLKAAENEVLNIFHCPVQSNNPEVLKDMHRDVSATLEIIDIAKSLKKLGVTIATNIIIDYKNYLNSFEEIFSIYDYVSWNPLWDNQWNREKAEARFEYYINHSA